MDSSTYESLPSFGCDIDGVLYKWDPTARYLLLYEYDGPLPMAAVAACQTDSLSWDHLKDSIPHEAWKWLWTEGVRRGLFRYGHLYKGAATFVTQLATLCRVIALTHRPQLAYQDTLDWLTFTRMPFDRYRILVNQEPKSTVPCDYYLDDKLENVIELRQNSNARKVFLLDRPWNQHNTPAGVRRVFDFDEVLKEVGR